MKDFKVGDSVICTISEVAGNLNLIKFKTYKVLGTWDNDILIDINGIHTFVTKYRFEKYDFRKEKILKLKQMMHDKM